jgi:hypothetical protein
MLLDAAHDAEAIYLLLDHQNIEPFIDLNNRRTHHTHSSDNLRLFLKIRGSAKWTNIFKRRTSIERSNKRKKIDYKLESGRHRSTMMWYMRLHGIMIANTWMLGTWAKKKNGTRLSLFSNQLPPNFLKKGLTKLDESAHL